MKRFYILQKIFQKNKGMFDLYKHCTEKLRDQFLHLTLYKNTSWHQIPRVHPNFVEL